MTTRLALSTKIFLLAFLNIALLAAVFLIFARVQFHMGIGSLLFAPAEDRVVGRAQQVELELEERPKDLRDALMQRLSVLYNAEFYLFEMPSMKQVAGHPVQLPQVVLDELQRPPADGGLQNAPPPPRQQAAPPPPHDFDRGSPDFDRDGTELERHPPPGRDGPPGARRPPRREPPPDVRRETPPGDPSAAPGVENPPAVEEFQRPRLLEVSTRNPSVYWVGARIPLRSPGVETA